MDEYATMLQAAFPDAVAGACAAESTGAACGRPAAAAPAHEPAGALAVRSGAPERGPPRTLPAFRSLRPILDSSCLSSV